MTKAVSTTRHGRFAPGTLGLVALVATLWGTPYLLIAVALVELPPVLVVFGRCTVAAVALLALALRSGRLSVPRRHWPWIAVLGVLEFAAPFTLIAVGEQTVPSSLAGILVASAPLFVAALAPLLDPSESPRGWRAVGLVAGFSGVVMVMGVDVADASLTGGLLILVAALSYVLAAYVLKLKLAGLPAVSVIGLATAFASVIMVPPALWSLPVGPTSAMTVLSVVVLGLGSTAVAFTLFAVLNARVGPGRASVVAYLAPGFSVLLGVAVLDEPVGVSTVSGLALILGGSWLAARAGRQPAAPTVPAVPDGDPLDHAAPPAPDDTGRDPLQDGRTRPGGP